MRPKLKHIFIGIIIFSQWKNPFNSHDPIKIQQPWISSDKPARNRIAGTYFPILKKRISMKIEIDYTPRCNGTKNIHCPCAAATIAHRHCKQISFAIEQMCPNRANILQECENECIHVLDICERSHSRYKTSLFVPVPILYGPAEHLPPLYVCGYLWCTTS